MEFGEVINNFYCGRLADQDKRSTKAKFARVLFADALPQDTHVTPVQAKMTFIK